MINIRQFIKKLVMLDVFWGRRSKIHHGIKDGGAGATTIDDVQKAKVYKGNSIYNVNDSDNEVNGGHFHDPSLTLDDALITVSGDIIVENQGNIVHK